MRLGVLLLAGSALTLSLLAGCSGGGSASNSAPSSSTNSTPKIATVAPESLPAGSPATTLTITGTGYTSSTSVTLNGAALQTTYVNATSLQVVVPASILASGQVANLMVSNPGGASSAPVGFSIISPTPKVTGLSPMAVPQGISATVTVSGSGFEANSVVMYNGSTRPTTFVNSTTLQVDLTADDLKSLGTGQVNVNNPGPGGSATTPTELVIAASIPTITVVSPAPLTVNTSTTAPVLLSISGKGFALNATVQANGANIPINSRTATYISALLPPSYIASASTIKFVVSNPGSPVVQSNIVTVSVIAPSTNFTITPNSAPAGSPDTKITVYGNGFFPDSVVQWNGSPLATTYVGNSQLTAIIPASLLSGFAQASIEVSTPESTGPTPPPQPFTTFLALPVNDIVYNAVDGLIYASIPGYAGGTLGNTVAGIDPATGAIVKTIFVGSEPTRMALSTDGTQLFVGLNGAGAVRQVNLTTATAGIQFSLGGGPGVYNAPYTAQSL
ncbi:MAG TPA: IPT/TIG domain-containing protein, partial [Edaphobacter sp.]|nr:IPT/TIG domain-containing protein [Edaphobacter sp.]